MITIDAEHQDKIAMFLRSLNVLAIGLIFILGALGAEKAWAQCTPPPNPTATTTPTYCNANNGSLSFTNASPQLYDYSIDGGTTYQASATFLNLPQGAKQTRIRYKTTLCQSAIVTQTVAFAASPAATSITATVGNVTNCTAVNGSITFTAPTPLSSYQFSIDGGVSFQTSQSFTSLPAGSNYKLVIKSVVTGCQSVTSAANTRTIIITGAPTSHTTTSTATYCATNNGSITFTGAAPTPLSNYAYSLNGGGYQTSPTFLNLAQGSYQTRIVNKTTGCPSPILTQTVAYTASPAATSITATVGNVTNCTAVNGSLTFTAPTPLSSYQFSIDGGVSFQTSQSFTNLPVGSNYKLVIKSVVTGCQSVTSTTNTRAIIITGAPTAHTTTSTPTYCATNNGSITFTGATPTPLSNYAYSLNGGAYQTSPTFLNLAQGSYQTRIVNKTTGCPSPILTQTVAYTASPAATSITATVGNVTNCTAVNGSLTFTAPTPLSSYQFSIDGGVSFQTSQSFTNLPVGSNYKLVIKSTITGCSSITTVANTRAIIINSSSVPGTPAGTTTPSSCTNATGTITFTAPTPTSAFVYSIDGGTSFGDANEVTFDSLSVGRYIVRAQSRTTGCLSVTSAITVPPVATIPTPTATLTRPTDCNNPNGSINFTSPLSAPPSTIYQYSIDGGESFGDPANTLFSNLQPDEYVLIAMNMTTGCVSPLVSVTLTANPVVNAPGVNLTQLSECNPTGGAIQFTSPTPLVNYEFSIDSGATFVPQQVLFSNLTIGNYYTVVRSIATGCQSVIVSRILSYNFTKVDATISAQNQDACLTNAGSITIAATGGTGVYQYSTNGGQTYQNLTQNPLVINALPVGNYIVVVRDKANPECIDQSNVQLAAANCPVPIPLVKE